MYKSPMNVLPLLAAMVGLLLAGPGFAAKDSPFTTSKKEFRKSVKTVSLAPLTSPDMFELSDPVRAMIEAEATRQLSKMKVEAIGIEPYAQLRRTMASQIGGLMTAEGVIDPRRRQAVWNHAKREMRHQYPIDAFAEISLRVVSAAFDDDRAEWDGVRQKVIKSGDGFSLFGGKNYQGSIAAASFQLTFYDRSDELLFANRGGIEVLQERQGAQLVLRDAGLLFQDEKKLKKAVQLAFKPL